MRIYSIRTQILGLITPCFLLFAGFAHSQAKPEATSVDKSEKKDSQIEFVATVNGAPITQGLLDLNIKAAVSQGQKDTPQLRQAIKEELINRALIAQEATRQGLDKEIDFKDQYTQLKQSLLMQAFIDERFKKSPITEATLLEEYEKQKQAMGGGNTALQYQLSQIILSSEAEAIAVIGRLQNGESFAKVAKEASRDAATKSQGGLVGWVMVPQVATPIADIMANLPKGSFSTSPIKLQGAYVVIKVDDIRSTKIATFKESKNQIRQALIQKYLSESIKKLRESAKVVQ
jgi:peptidyl-prolyl cis-trans isomerase C